MNDIIKTINGVHYLIKGEAMFGYPNVATVISAEKTLAKVEILHEVDGIPVVGIVENAFYLCEMLEAITIPDSIRVIGKNAFYGSAIKQITLPALVDEVEESTFENCDALEKVTLCGVKQIKKNAFKGCTNLKTITFPILEDAFTYAFEGCYNLEFVEFPASFITLGKAAFKDCYSLREVVFKSGINIQDETFINCISLEKIVFPDNISEIGSNIFYRNQTEATVVCGSEIGKMTTRHISATSSQFPHICFSDTLKANDAFFDQLWKTGLRTREVLLRQSF